MTNDQPKHELLLSAAYNAYVAWYGGTMNDVREAMKQLGEVLNDLDVYDESFN